MRETVSVWRDGAAPHPRSAHGAARALHIRLLHKEARLGHLGESGDVLELGRDDVEDLCARLLARIRTVFRTGEQVAACWRKDRFLEGFSCQRGVSLRAVVLGAAAVGRRHRKCA